MDWVVEKLALLALALVQGFLIAALVGAAVLIWGAIQ